MAEEFESQSTQITQTYNSFSQPHYPKLLTVQIAETYISALKASQLIPVQL